MAIKIGLNTLTPFFSLGLRYLTAGICLAIYLWIVDRKITLQKRQLKLLILITLFNYIVPYSLVYWAEQFIYSDIASVIFAMLPINVATVCFFYQEEKFAFYEWLGILISFAGILIIFSETVFKGMRFHLYAMIAVYFSSLSQAVMTIILKKYKGKYHPLKINLFPILLTGIIITGFSFAIENLNDNVLRLSGIISIFYLSIFGTVIAFALYFWLIGQIKLSLVSSTAYILPIIAIFFGWIFLNEKLSSMQLSGSAMVLGGVFITTKK
jgi:drug/metabolite transporter (DMT)-like permease